jgi:hypothetical protein
MARQLHQHPEGHVIVRTEEGTYLASRQQFAEDSPDPLPLLPEGITERIYEPGVRHALMRGNDVVDGGPMPWPEGDKVLASAGPLKAKAEKRRSDWEKKDKADRLAAAEAEARKIDPKRPPRDPARDKELDDFEKEWRKAMSEGPR